MDAMLKAARRPLVFGNMTTAELLREAEHTFPNPSPIVDMLLQHLRSDGRTLAAKDGRPAGDPQFEAAPCQCPTCGAHLTVEVK